MEAAYEKVMERREREALMCAHTTRTTSLYAGEGSAQRERETQSETRGGGNLGGIVTLNMEKGEGAMRRRRRRSLRPWWMASTVLLFLSMTNPAKAEAVTNECNATITRPTRVTVPILKPHLRGSYFFCTVSIRTPDPESNDVIAIDFRRLKLGDIGPVKECHRRYLVIQDGNSRGEEGRWCGESDQPHFYYAEDQGGVDVVIVSETFDDMVDYDFSVSWVPRNRLPERFGPRPDLFPDLRGNLVAKTVCERVFQVRMTLLTGSSSFPPSNKSPLPLLRSVLDFIPATSSPPDFPASTHVLSGAGITSARSSPTSSCILTASPSLTSPAGTATLSSLVPSTPSGGGPAREETPLASMMVHFLHSKI